MVLQRPLWPVRPGVPGAHLAAGVESGGSAAAQRKAALGLEVVASVVVPAGDLVYLEMGRLLFGEAGSVPGYCCVARVIVVVLCKVLALANGAYMDDYGAVYWTVD